MKGGVVQRGVWNDRSHENGVGAYIAHGVCFCCFFLFAGSMAWGFFL